MRRLRYNPTRSDTEMHPTQRHDASVAALIIQSSFIMGSDVLPTALLHKLPGQYYSVDKKPDFCLPNGENLHKQAYFQKC